MAKQELTAENVLKLLNNGLSDRNLIKRLFDDQMTQNIVSMRAAIQTTTDIIKHSFEVTSRKIQLT
jgi:hypothetical protein